MDWDTVAGVHDTVRSQGGCGYGCRLWLQALAIMAVISWFLAPALNMRTAHSAACNHSSASL